MEPYHCKICDVWIDDGEPHPPQANEILRCPTCGEFYTERTVEAHSFCQSEEDREQAGL